MYSPILIYAPSEILRTVATPLADEEINQDLADLASDMIYIMHARSGIGLAAPQVSISKRIIVISSGPEDLVMINPEIIGWSDNSMNIPEQCISLPECDPVDVIRKQNIVVKYKDLNKQEQERTCSLLESVVIQHEIDHLNGITLFERMSPLKRTKYNKKINNIKKQIKAKIGKPLKF